MNGAGITCLIGTYAFRGVFLNLLLKMEPELIVEFLFEFSSLKQIP